MVAASDRAPVCFSLSAGNEHDFPNVKELIQSAQIPPSVVYCTMDKGHESDDMRTTVTGMCLIPVVPPKINRKVKWDYDKEIYKRRNEVERFFLRIKRYRRIATRYDKLDLMFIGYIFFAVIVESLRRFSVNSI